jgi:hypothetical protein
MACEDIHTPGWYQQQRAKNTIVCGEEANRKETIRPADDTRLVDRISDTRAKNQGFVERVCVADRMKRNETTFLL